MVMKGRIDVKILDMLPWTGAHAYPLFQIFVHVLCTYETSAVKSKQILNTWIEVDTFAPR